MPSADQVSVKSTHRPHACATVGSILGGQQACLFGIEPSLAAAGHCLISATEIAATGHAGAPDRLVLQHSAELGACAVLTSLGLRTAMNTTRHSTLATKVARQKTSLMSDPTYLHFGPMRRRGNRIGVRRICTGHLRPILRWHGLPLRRLPGAS